MPFPATLDDLKHAGYTFEFSRACIGCGVHLEFWKTPENRRIPLEIDSTGKVTAHWFTCPNAEQFRKGRSDATHKKIAERPNLFQNPQAAKTTSQAHAQAENPPRHDRRQNRRS